MEIEIRKAAAGEADALVILTAEVFCEASIDAAIAEKFGGTSWIETKGAAVRNELRNNPEGCFVALYEGKLAGYITTTVNTVASRGVIANIAVRTQFQGKKIGRALIERALEWFRTEGLQQAKIETLVTNQAGQHLYTAMGFEEVARQIHFAMPLR